MTLIVRETRIAADHPCLAGHFPGRPIVPAVLLLECVAEALRGEFGSIRLGGVKDAKFLAPVKPEQTIAIHLDLDATAGKAVFHCRVDAVLVAKGELAFAVPG